MPTSTPSTVRDERRRQIGFSEKMMKLIVLALALVATTTSVNGHAVELTKDNFDATVHDNGKNTLISSAVVGHCKRMKPDWDKLGAEYDGSSVVIGDADCTKEQALCSDYGVQGYLP